jgi:hypothetical protein
MQIRSQNEEKKPPPKQYLPRTENTFYPNSTCQEQVKGIIIEEEAEAGGGVKTLGRLAHGRKANGRWAWGQLTHMF